MFDEIAFTIPGALWGSRLHSSSFAQLVQPQAAGYLGGTLEILSVFLHSQNSLASGVAGPWGPPVLSRQLHTHPEIVELRPCPTACATQVLCLRPTTSDKATLEIIVWRCLWDILPTIFFNRAILLLRNFQGRPSFSRISAEYLKLGSLTNGLQLIIWGHLLLYPFFSFWKLPSFAPGYQDRVFATLGFTLMSLVLLKLSHCTQPAYPQIPLLLFVSQNPPQPVQSGPHAMSPLGIPQSPPSHAILPITELLMPGVLVLAPTASLS